MRVLALKQEQIGSIYLPNFLEAFWNDRKMLCLLKLLFQYSHQDLFENVKYPNCELYCQEEGENHNFKRTGFFIHSDYIFYILVGDFWIEETTESQTITVPSKIYDFELS